MGLAVDARDRITENKVDHNQDDEVAKMLAATQRKPEESIGAMPPRWAQATVEKIAINAVIAGCKPEYLPVLIAALEAVCTDEFNIHGVMATTWGATPRTWICRSVARRR